MSSQLSNVLILLGVALLFIVLWVASTVIAYLDVSRRNLTRMERVTWVALVALLPVIGLFVYLFIRFLTYFLVPDPPADASSASGFRRRETLSMRPEPAAASEYSGTIPMADLYATPGLQGQPARVTRPAYAMGVIMGPHVGEEFLLDNFPVLIGRAVDATIRLNEDTSVSRKHAELYVQGGDAQENGEIRIRDLGSTHGTFLNELRVMDGGLGQGDQVRVGATVMILRTREGR